MEDGPDALKNRPGPIVPSHYCHPWTVSFLSVLKFKEFKNRLVKTQGKTWGSLGVRRPGQIWEPASWNDLFFSLPCVILSREVGTVCVWTGGRTEVEDAEAPLISLRLPECDRSQRGICFFCGFLAWQKTALLNCYRLFFPDLVASVVLMLPGYGKTAGISSFPDRPRLSPGSAISCFLTGKEEVITYLVGPSWGLNKKIREKHQCLVFSRSSRIGNLLIHL